MVINNREPLKCKKGHNLPANSAVESYGAVFEGGVCSICGELVQGKFLGNAWSGEEEKTVMVPDLDSVEGKAAISECFNKMLRGGKSNAMAALKDLNRKSEELPKKSGSITIMNGLDFSKFERDGWVITRLPT